MKKKIWELYVMSVDLGVPNKVHVNIIFLCIVFYLPLIVMQNY